MEKNHWTSWCSFIKRQEQVWPWINCESVCVHHNWQGYRHAHTHTDTHTQSLRRNHTYTQSRDVIPSLSCRCIVQVPQFVISRKKKGGKHKPSVEDMFLLKSSFFLELALAYRGQLSRSLSVMVGGGLRSFIADGKNKVPDDLGDSGGFWAWVWWEFPRLRLTLKHFDLQLTDRCYHPSTESGLHTETWRCVRIKFPFDRLYLEASGWWGLALTCHNKLMIWQKCISNVSTMAVIAMWLKQVEFRGWQVVLSLVSKRYEKRKNEFVSVRAELLSKENKQPEQLYLLPPPAPPPTPHEEVPPCKSLFMSSVDPCIKAS